MRKNYSKSRYFTFSKGYVIRGHDQGVFKATSRRYESFTCQRSSSQRPEAPEYTAESLLWESVSSAPSNNTQDR